MTYLTLDELLHVAERAIPVRFSTRLRAGQVVASGDLDDVPSITAVLERSTEPRSREPMGERSGAARP